MISKCSIMQAVGYLVSKGFRLCAFGLLAAASLTARLRLSLALSFVP